ncbi:MAG: hypothetical protein ACTHJK_10290 [Sphingomicrobium sp.]
MSRVDAAAPMDRLPWLSDDPTPKPQRKRRGSIVIWGGGAFLAVAAGGFWIGTRTAEPSARAPAQQAQSTATVRLPPSQAPSPEVRPVPQPEVRMTPQPEVRPEPMREVHIAPPVRKVATKEARKSGASEQQVEAQSAANVAPPPPAAAPAAPPFVLPRPWPPRVIKGAAGRLVQVGAFGSIHQAKRGWWFMVRAYPAMAHLPAVVRVTRNSKGRPFYRFQVGTTSQAHSEVLCQRMLKIDLSCAVIGLPWKARVER